MHGKKILIVEDDRSLAEQLMIKLMEKDKERVIKWVDNRADAINNLRSFCPNVVLLDLGIYESKERRAIQEMNNGVAVAQEIIQLNKKHKDLNIQLIFITATLRDENIRTLVSQAPAVHHVINKGDDDYKDQAVNAVEFVLGNPLDKDARLDYKAFDIKMMSELKDCDPYAATVIESYILSSFREDDPFECIVRCGNFTKYLYGEFTLDKNKELQELKKTFGTGKVSGIRNEDPRKWNEKWDEVVSKGIIREIDKNFAVTSILARNSSTHDGEGALYPQKYTINDAATAIQLLVPLVVKYIVFKRK